MQTTQQRQTNEALQTINKEKKKRLEDQINQLKKNKGLSQVKTEKISTPQLKIQQEIPHQFVLTARRTQLNHDEDLQTKRKRVKLIDNLPQKSFIKIKSDQQNEVQKITKKEQKQSQKEEKPTIAIDETSLINQTIQIVCQQDPIDIRLNIDPKQIFPLNRFSYTILTSQTLIQFKKQIKRFRNNDKVITLNQSKIHLKEKYIDASKTITIQFFMQKLIKKQCLHSELKNLRFWIFKGALRKFQQVIIQNLSSGHNFVQSKGLIQLTHLYQWYTLAHLQSAFNNLFFIVERHIPFIILKCIGKFCIFCNKQARSICLCNDFLTCKKQICCQNTDEYYQRHETLCKYSSPYKIYVEKTLITQNSNKGLIGLYNYQNTCFMNTALQCLAACQPLTEYFLQKNYIRNINQGNKMGTFGQIAIRYGQFIRQIWTSNKPFIRLDKFRRSLIKWDNKYNNNDQQDSQQFLIQILDWLKQDLNLNIIKQKIPQSINTQKLDLQDQAQRAWKIYLSRNNSIIEYLMAGMLRSTIQCVHCMYESHNFQVFTTLPLPVTKTETQRCQNFQITICVIFHNFQKKSACLKVTLNSYSYDQLIIIVSKQLDLLENTVLLGIAFGTNQAVKRINTSIQGCQEIIKSKQTPQTTKICFLQYLKSDITKNGCQINFRVKVPFQDKLKFISYARPLFFAQKSLATSKQIHKRILKYFYKFIFRNAQKISEQTYYQKYMQAQTIPFTMIMSSSSSSKQIKITDEITILNKTNIEVIFQNLSDFNIHQLKKAVKHNKKIKADLHNNQKTYNTNLTIYDCFKQFSKPELIQLDNCWYCSNCKQKRKAKKKMTIYKAPKVLILFFKRFSMRHHQNHSRMKKIQTFVQFPHMLDISKFVERKELPYTSQIKEPNYRLFAVANHMRIKSGCQIGHYTASICHNNQWYNINDQKFAPIGQSDVCNRNAYILFYNRSE